MFSKNKPLQKSARRVDKIVTGIIIGGAIASVFGLSQTKKGKEITSSVASKITPNVTSGGKKALSLFGKIIAFFVYLFSKK